MKTLDWGAVSMFSEGKTNFGPFNKNRLKQLQKQQIWNEEKVSPTVGYCPGGDVRDQCRIRGTAGLI